MSCILINTYYLSFTAGVPDNTGVGDYINIINQNVMVSGTTTPFGIQLLDDSTIEPPEETFQLVLSAADSLASIPAAGSIGTITINEDDGEQ